MAGCGDSLSRHDTIASGSGIIDRDEEHGTVTFGGQGASVDDTCVTSTTNAVGPGHCPPSTLLHQHHDSDDSENGSSLSTIRCRATCGGHVSTDSEDSGSFDVLRTLGPFRRGHHHPQQSSSSSGCSCESCASHSDASFFGSEEGPPGGENTAQRRTAVWLENIRVNWAFLVLGLLVFSVVLTIIALVMAETGSSSQIGQNMLYWTVPLVAATAGIVIAWNVAQHLLWRRGYCKGDHIMERWNLIRDAQAKGLLYSVRGAIYAPTRHRPRRRHHRPVYKVVAYESEFDSETYFDSDLESDGQYRRSLTPWQEVEDLYKRERRNIYTRRAWFRDVPVVWWELLPHFHRDL